MNGKECCRCGSFDAYFTKAYCSFLRTDCGNCRKFNKIVKKHSTCSDWRSRWYVGTKAKKSAVLKELGEIVTKINILKEFVEEDK